MTWKTISSVLVIAILLLWSCSILYGQSSSQLGTATEQDEEELIQSDLEVSESASIPFMYTMTKGTFEGAGRVLLSSNDASTASALGSQGQIGVQDETPEDYALYSNYPNPFNPTTTVRFDLPMSSIVTLKVYNVLGQEVASLLDHVEMDEGEQEIEFSAVGGSASGGNANDLASGVYFYRLEARDVGNRSNIFVQTKKMLLLK
ncbi:MAG: T9SS type A sorting domain-containing protein [Ignavibacteria bacterium]|nr:T9SS type A sorting domain-containing protein [Ignavibacteria bacterium]MBI3764895.1 T9SS type A sorting domain-containing protein [Ignavibacteriales bacterium]